MGKARLVDQNFALCVGREKLTIEEKKGVKKEKNLAKKFLG